MPATSPTLSPTLSAMVAGLRGSSSGMPASTLPDRSPATSAALVKMPPPTRANSAMDDAPSDIPSSDPTADGPRPSRPPYSQYRRAMPRVPRATTVRPMTAPLENATRRAPARLVRAAAVVRTAAPVAVRMPIHPAVADRSAPTRKLTPTRKELPGRNRTRTPNMTTTNTARTLYSVRRKAIAPRRIRAAICCMRSVPASWALMVRIRESAKRAAATGAPTPRST